MYEDMNKIKRRATLVARVSAFLLWLLVCVAFFVSDSTNGPDDGSIESGSKLYFGPLWVVQQFEAVWLTLLLISTPYSVLRRKGQICCSWQSFFKIWSGLIGIINAQCIMWPLVLVSLLNIGGELDELGTFASNFFPSCFHLFLVLYLLLCSPCFCKLDKSRMRSLTLVIYGSFTVAPYLTQFSGADGDPKAKWLFAGYAISIDDNDNNDDNAGLNDDNYYNVDDDNGSGDWGGDPKVKTYLWISNVIYLLRLFLGFSGMLAIFLGASDEDDDESDEFPTDLYAGNAPLKVPLNYPDQTSFNDKELIIN